MSSELQNTLNDILNDKNTNLKPENLKAGVTCLGVNGALTFNGAKLFSTVDEMNSSTGNNLGDLSIVYSDKLEDVSNGVVLSVAKFPKTVTLDEAETEVISGTLKSSLTQEALYSIVLNSTTYLVRLSDGRFGRTVIQYTSSDGITYTRSTDLENDEYTFSSSVTVDWNDEILNLFLKKVQPTFGGFYEYSVNPTGSTFIGKPQVVKDDADDKYYTYLTPKKYISNLDDIYYNHLKPHLLDLGITISNNCEGFLFDRGNNQYDFMYSSNNPTQSIVTSGSIFVNDDGIFVGIGNNGSSSNQSKAQEYDLYKLSFNINDGSYTNTKLEKTLAQDWYDSKGEYYYYAYKLEDTDMFLRLHYKGYADSS